MQLREHLGHLAAQHGPTNGLTGGISPLFPVSCKGQFSMGLASLELAGRRGKRKPGSKQKESEESYFMDQNTP